MLIEYSQKKSSVYCKRAENNVCPKNIKYFILQNRKTDRQNTKVDAPKSEKVAKKSDFYNKQGRENYVS